MILARVWGIKSSPSPSNSSSREMDSMIGRRHGVVCVAGIGEWFREVMIRVAPFLEAFGTGVKFEHAWETVSKTCCGREMNSKWAIHGSRW